MNSALGISRVSFIAASSFDIERGLLGFVRLELGGLLVLDGISVRRTLDGRLRLSFPCRQGKAGKHHAYIRPLDAQARAVIERQVFEALGLKENVA